MAEMVELFLGEDGWELADDAADIRVSQTLWNRYTKAHAALAGVKAEISKTAKIVESAVAEDRQTVHQMIRQSTEGRQV